MGDSFLTLSSIQYYLHVNKSVPPDYRSKWGELGLEGEDPNVIPLLIAHEASEFMNKNSVPSIGIDVAHCITSRKKGCFEGKSDGNQIATVVDWAVKITEYKASDDNSASCKTCEDLNSNRQAIDAKESALYGAVLNACYLSVYKSVCAFDSLISGLAEEKKEWKESAMTTIQNCLYASELEKNKQFYITFESNAIDSKESLEFIKSNMMACGFKSKLGLKSGIWYMESIPASAMLHHMKYLFAARGGSRTTTTTKPGSTTPTHLILRLRAEKVPNIFGSKQRLDSTPPFLKPVDEGIQDAIKKSKLPEENKQALYEHYIEMVKRKGIHDRTIHALWYTLRHEMGATDEELAKLRMLFQMLDMGFSKSSSLSIHTGHNASFASIWMHNISMRIEDEMNKIKVRKFGKEKMEAIAPRATPFEWIGPLIDNYIEKIFGDSTVDELADIMYPEERRYAKENIGVRTPTKEETDEGDEGEFSNPFPQTNFTFDQCASWTEQYLDSVLNQYIKRELITPQTRAWIMKFMDVLKVKLLDLKTDSQGKMKVESHIGVDETKKTENAGFWDRLKSGMYIVVTAMVMGSLLGLGLCYAGGINPFAFLRDRMNMCGEIDKHITGVSERSDAKKFMNNETRVFDLDGYVKHLESKIRSINHDIDLKTPTFNNMKSNSQLAYDGIRRPIDMVKEAQDSYKEVEKAQKMWQAVGVSMGDKSLPMPDLNEEDAAIVSRASSELMDVRDDVKTVNYYLNGLQTIYNIGGSLQKTLLSPLSADIFQTSSFTHDGQPLVGKEADIIWSKIQTVMADPFPEGISADASAFSRDVTRDSEEKVMEILKKHSSAFTEKMGGKFESTHKEAIQGIVSLVAGQRLGISMAMNKVQNARHAIGILNAAKMVEGQAKIIGTMADRAINGMAASNLAALERSIEEEKSVIGEIDRLMKDRLETEAIKHHANDYFTGGPDTPGGAVSQRHLIDCNTIDSMCAETYSDTIRYNKLLGASATTYAGYAKFLIEEQAIAGGLSPYISSLVFNMLGGSAAEYMEKMLRLGFSANRIWGSTDFGDALTGLFSILGITVRGFMAIMEYRALVHALLSVGVVLGKLSMTFWSKFLTEDAEAFGSSTTTLHGRTNWIKLMKLDRYMRGIAGFWVHMGIPFCMRLIHGFSVYANMVSIMMGIAMIVVTAWEVLQIIWIFLAGAIVGFALFGAVLAPLMAPLKPVIDTFYSMISALVFGALFKVGWTIMGLSLSYMSLPVRVAAYVADIWNRWMFRIEAELKDSPPGSPGEADGAPPASGGASNKMSIWAVTARGVSWWAAYWIIKWSIRFALRMTVDRVIVSAFDLLSPGTRGIVDSTDGIQNWESGNPASELRQRSEYMERMAAARSFMQEKVIYHWGREMRNYPAENGAFDRELWMKNYRTSNYLETVKTLYPDWYSMASRQAQSTISKATTVMKEELRVISEGNAPVIPYNG